MNTTVSAYVPTAKKQQLCYKHDAIEQYFKKHNSTCDLGTYPFAASYAFASSKSSSPERSFSRSTRGGLNIHEQA